MFRPNLLFALLLTIAGDPSQAANEFIEAVLHSPSVEAALQRSKAANQRINASGRWGDPELEGMYAGKDTPEESMPMWGVTLKQALPKYGERKADRARAQAATIMAEAEARMMAGEVASETARALAERDAARLRVSLLQRQLEQTERALAAVDVRIGTGQGRLSESLALQSRVTSLRLEVEKETVMVDEAEREVRQMLGLDADVSLPEFDAPNPEDMKVELAPGIQSLDAQKNEARAMTDMARADARPMTEVGLLFEREESNAGNEDTIGVTFMTDLPWNSRRYARAEALAALAELESREAEIDVLKRRLESDRIRAERLIHFAELTQKTVKENQARLDREYEAWIETTGTGGAMESSSVLMLIDLLDRSTELHLQAIEAETAARTARADLWRYQPFTLGE